MIIFDQLRISDNGKLLYLNAHVNKASYFDNMVMDKVIIQTAEQVSETDPLTPGSEFIYQLDIDNNTTKELDLVLNAATDFSNVYNTLSDKLLFVYIVCKGAVDACTPCRLDELTTLGVTFDETVYYQKVMQYTKELVGNCNIPDKFTDFILLWNGFKAAIETEHYIEAIDFYNKMFRGKNVGFTTSNCGCHG